MTLRVASRILFITLLGMGDGHAARTPPAVQPAPDLPVLEAESKVVWGQMLDTRERSAFGYFSDWLRQSRTAGKGGLAQARDFDGAAIVPLGPYLTRKDMVLAAAKPNVVPGTPDAPLKVDSEGENYQGVNVALVRLDPGGRQDGFDILSDGIRSGIHFKLRITPTFDAMVVVGRINPDGIQNQIYPAKPGQVVVIPAGRQTLLPLGEKEYLLFTGANSRDRLVFTIRDPRSLEAGLAAGTPVFRNDDADGSNFMQEVQPDHFPVIAEAIRLRPRDPALP